MVKELDDDSDGLTGEVPPEDTWGAFAAEKKGIAESLADVDIRLAPVERPRSLLEQIVSLFKPPKKSDFMLWPPVPNQPGSGVPVGVRIPVSPVLNVTNPEMSDELREAIAEFARTKPVVLIPNSVTFDWPEDGTGDRMIVNEESEFSMPFPPMPLAIEHREAEENYELEYPLWVDRLLAIRRGVGVEPYIETEYKGSKVKCMCFRDTAEDHTASCSEYITYQLEREKVMAMSASSAAAKAEAEAPDFNTCGCSECSVFRATLAYNREAVEGENELTLVLMSLRSMSGATHGIAADHIVKQTADRVRALFEAVFKEPTPPMDAEVVETLAMELYNSERTHEDSSWYNAHPTKRALYKSRVQGL